MSRSSPYYLKATQEAEKVDSPALGFLIAREVTSGGAGLLGGVQALIKQNNTIIELLIQLSDHQRNLDQRLSSIERSFGKQTEGVNSEELDSIIKRIENLSLGPQEKPKETKGKLRVFKDPKVILQEELEKLKR